MRILSPIWIPGSSGSSCSELSLTVALSVMVACAGTVVAGAGPDSLLPSSVAAARQIWQLSPTRSTEVEFLKHLGVFSERGELTEQNRRSIDGLTTVLFAYGEEPTCSWLRTAVTDADQTGFLDYVVFGSDQWRSRESSRSEWQPGKDTPFARWERESMVSVLCDRLTRNRSCRQRLARIVTKGDGSVTWCTDPLTKVMRRVPHADISALLASLSDPEVRCIGTSPSPWSVVSQRNRQKHFWFPPVSLAPFCPFAVCVRNREGLEPPISLRFLPDAREVGSMAPEDVSLFRLVSVAVGDDATVFRLTDAQTDLMSSSMGRGATTSLGAVLDWLHSQGRSEPGPAASIVTQEGRILLPTVLTE